MGFSSCDTSIMLIVNLGHIIIVLTVMLCVGSSKIGIGPQGNFRNLLEVGRPLGYF